jgi:hypothetical protein
VPRPLEGQAARDALRVRELALDRGRHDGRRQREVEAAALELGEACDGRVLLRRCGRGTAEEREGGEKSGRAQKSGEAHAGQAALA